MLFFCLRGLYLLYRQRYRRIEYATVHTVRLFREPPRFFHMIEQTNVGSPRHVFDCLPIGRIIHELVKRLLDIVMLKLLACCCIICDLTCNISRELEADSSVHFNQPHSAIEVKAEQLT